MTENTTIGRNEPCTCGSGKKYKRCCGINAAPKLTAPAPKTGPAGKDPSAMPNVDPKMMTQFAQAFQRLPKGQLQRLQSIMQRAMAGKDVAREAAELEASLPPDFQEMLKGFQMPGMDAATASAPAESAAPQMTEEEARALVAKAAQEGKVSQEKAQELLSGSEEKKAGISGFFKKLGGGAKKAE